VELFPRGLVASLAPSGKDCRTEIKSYDIYKDFCQFGRLIQHDHMAAVCNRIRAPVRVVLEDIIKLLKGAPIVRGRHKNPLASKP